MIAPRARTAAGKIGTGICPDTMTCDLHHGIPVEWGGDWLVLTNTMILRQVRVVRCLTAVSWRLPTGQRTACDVTTKDDFLKTVKNEVLPSNL
jgi:hypothetical protein